MRFLIIHLSFILSIMMLTACSDAEPSLSQQLEDLTSDQAFINTRPVLDQSQSFNEDIEPLDSMMNLNSRKDQSMVQDRNLLDQSQEQANIDDQFIPSEIPQPPENCLDGDLDGDGFNQSANCPTPDCNDQNPSISPFSFEACNGLDDDCDGQIDESQIMMNCGVGACTTQMSSCQNGQIQRCQPLAPSVELCDGIDNNCDGIIDNASTISCGVGACYREVSSCQANLCEPLAPSAENCDGIDNDCDGQIDNGFKAMTMGRSFADISRAHDQCNTASRHGPACNAAVHRLCMNGCQNTGFGLIEHSDAEGYMLCVQGTDLQVSVASLTQFHEDCRSDNRISPPCNAARHRFCQNRGFVSGFGPVENGLDDMTVSCVSSGDVLMISFEELASRHGGCAQFGQLTSNDCNAAISRSCQARGYVSGFGPVEVIAEGPFVVCMRP